MTTAALRDAVKRFRGPDGRAFEALSHITLTIPESAHFTVIVGPDGAGKSTLMRVLAGLMRLDEGEATLLGLSPNDQTLPARTGFMPQRFGLYEDLTVEENLETFATLKGVPDTVARPLQAELLQLTGLAGFETRLAGALSGGMKQKLGLCATLLSTPEVLLLDEPTVGVDPLSRQELLSILATRAASTGMRTIMTSSNLSEAMHADLVVLMQAGRIVVADKPAALLAPLTERTFSITAGPRWDARRLLHRLIGEVQAEKGAEALFLDVTPEAGGIHVLTATRSDVTAIGEALAERGITGVAVGRRAPTMDDVVMASTAAEMAQPARTLVQSHSASTDAVIRVSHIRKNFGDFTAVADTSFSVRPGEIFGLLGPNGAGKTTTFRMLCALSAPSAGTIEVLGVALASAKAGIRARIGYVAQKFSLYEKLTVEQNLAYFGAGYGLTRPQLRKRIEEALDAFELRAWRWACGAISPLPQPCCMSQIFSFWTRPPRAQISPQGGRFGGVSSRSLRRASPPSSPRTTWRKPTTVIAS